MAGTVQGRRASRFVHGTVSARRIPAILAWRSRASLRCVLCSLVTCSVLFHPRLRVALALCLVSIARPAAADLYSMFVMSTEFIVDSSDIILLADAVPRGQKFDLQQNKTLRNLTRESVPWLLDGAELLTDRQREGHLKKIPVLLFARFDEHVKRQRVFHHIWLAEPEASVLAIPLDKLIHCMPHSDSGANSREFRWPVCLAVDGRRRLLTDPDIVLRFVQRRINRGVTDQRPKWVFTADQWHTFGYHTFQNAFWISAEEFDGSDTSWNILMPDDETTQQLITREVDAGSYRYAYIKYLKRFPDEPAMMARLQRGLHSDEGWIQWHCREALKELGVPETANGLHATELASQPRVPYFAFGIAAIAAALACGHRWKTSVRQ